MKKQSNLYYVWAMMKQRCLNPRNNSYAYYGARGIRFCPEWKHWKPFRDWALSHGYERGLSIDRIDNNGNYEPANCRWTDSKGQVETRKTGKPRRTKRDNPNWKPPVIA